MNEAIKSICEALKSEAEAVSDYTDRIVAMASTEGTDKVAMALETIRLDGVEHIQMLTLELTELMTASIKSQGGETDGE